MHAVVLVVVVVAVCVCVCLMWYACVCVCVCLVCSLFVFGFVVCLSACVEWTFVCVHTRVEPTTSTICISSDLSILSRLLS
jgi:hypothetical protein